MVEPAICTATLNPKSQSKLHEAFRVNVLFAFNGWAGVQSTQKSLQKTLIAIFCKPVEDPTAEWETLTLCNTVLLTE
ncbi:hypothetical protein K435DRAFT_779738 [Dendrothele bispora CBS 962.96]|uniref:Uncharacterized protein n=1 Tax=Dendrothele bispora (strain CBS 962.96) TaxID=1314807 RepID=A0A4V4HF56_DENBC|nr:hypothetical protein K435DRAFT_784883 [Dendrothele bispora CBS 962.96]THU93675.1 hypothetical protein K435DRAFT_779738 [Dendrothele bispora CBS 962.96]